MGISHFGQSASIAADQNDGKLGEEQGGVACCAKLSANKPGILRLDAVSDTPAVTPVYLWFSSDGYLRASKTIPTNQDSDGVVVSANQLSM